MFTGLVESSSQVTRWDTSQPGEHGVLEVAHAFRELPAPGDSISVDGACLTVTDAKVDTLAFQVSPETVARTYWHQRPPTFVHLERALALGDRLGGHLVTGHVDEVGRVERVDRSADGMLVTVQGSRERAALLVEKGSIAVNGVSLTVNALRDGSFELWLIPHTLEITRLGHLEVGEGINLEYDLLGKHVQRLVLAHLSGVGTGAEKDTPHGQ